MYDNTRSGREIKMLKSKNMFLGALVLFNIIAFGTLVYGICTKADYSLNQKENSYLIGASYMTMNNEFYKILNEEINARVEAEGDRFILRDPALDSDRQIEQIEEMLAEEIDVLVVAPVDWESLSSVLGRAKEQGVRIIVADTNVQDDKLVDCTITSDNYNAGVLVGEYFLEQEKDAKLIIMTHEAAKSGQDRVQGFLDTVSRQKGIEIVCKIECEGQTEIAMPALQKVIDQNIYFDHIFCLNDLASVGVVAALEENNMLDSVDVYGVDASPDSKALIKEGMMKASAAQFPSDLGCEIADEIYRLLDGKETEKDILVPVELITPENVEEFGIDRWQ